MTEGQQNLKLKTFCSGRLNPDSKACLLEINYVTDAKFFVFINIGLLWAIILWALFSLTWRCY